ncbi:Lipopolysaccharide-modifying protein [Niveomyces insectorum RCEF 264]|uniref:Lipopolysaccharide-modifying protein n=1 Tax=Niveomyces insectorum RCEF 264 TaxID=1081102 RepID=A0A167LLX4_9HYPO|nr:Lipopolysaccharide-modifying protein [Niveomyces insectorum RCEF 264]
MLNSRTAALHQLHRAIVTSPELIPDTYFAINIHDQPFGTAWGYSRAANPTFRSKATDDRNFLMPHFAFWAWKLPFVGSIGRAAAAIEQLERNEYPRLADKIPRAVWRGTAWFNSVHNPRLRQNLLAAAKGKDWADVEALNWVGGGGTNGQNASNALAIEDFCRYRYVLHTEGVAYSGRFQFLQMCASVTITPPIQWLQHTTHLIKPVFSSDLRTIAMNAANAVERAANTNIVHKRDKGDPRSTTGQEPTSSATGANNYTRSITTTRRGSRDPAEKRTGLEAWPVSFSGDEANTVFVAPDWSDLEETIAWLEAHPAVAQGIAHRQRDLFVGGGYFSPAAEVCYFRALVRGWSRVVRVDEREWQTKEGTSYEAFTLNNGD